MSDLFRLDGKVVAVIGAGSGIGEAVAIGAARQGAASVACFDVNEPAVAAVAGTIRDTGAATSHRALDIADEQAVESAFGACVDTYGRVDAVVCTPAINVRKPILNYTLAEFDKVVNLNLRANFATLMIAGRIMTAQK